MLVISVFWYTITRVLHTYALTQHIGTRGMGEMRTKHWPFCSNAGAIFNDML